MTGATDVLAQRHAVRVQGLESTQPLQLKLHFVLNFVPRQGVSSRLFYSILSAPLSFAQNKTAVVQRMLPSPRQSPTLLGMRYLLPPTGTLPNGSVVR